jgi:hypothetical protein
MKPQIKIWPKAKNKARPADRHPDQKKCRNEQSGELPGSTPGDRGMCQKTSEVQGSE